MMVIPRQNHVGVDGSAGAELLFALSGDHRLLQLTPHSSFTSVSVRRIVSETLLMHSPVSLRLTNSSFNRVSSCA
jgi:hypothetical protein